MLPSRATLLVAAVCFLSACGGGNPAAPPAGGNPTLPNMSAKIDGVLWQPTLAVQAINVSPGLYSITAQRITGPNNYTMILSLYNITGPGTYPLGVITTVFGGSAVLSLPPSGGWSTPLNGTAGEIVITTLTATRMVGTFRFETAPLQAGSPGNPRITEGTLDIPVSGAGGLARANQGSRMTGNIGGPFVASAVSGLLTNAGGSNPVFTIVGNDGTRSISMSVANMTGAGTYALQATTTVRSIQSSGIPGNLTATWGSQLAGGSGSIVITSVTADRFVGTFTGTLVPIAGGAAGTRTVSGSFDLARGL